MNMTRKKLYLDEATLKNIRSIRTERERLQITQGELALMLGINRRTLSGYECGTSYPILSVYLKLSEIFMWNIKDNPNYIFYHEYHKRIDKLKRQKKKYAYSNLELGHRANIAEETVRHVMKKNKQASVSSFAQVMKILSEEEELACIRKELLRRRSK